MNKPLVAIAASLGAGFALGAWTLYSPASAPVGATGADDVRYFDSSAALSDRIRALEMAVAEERNARQVLEEELQVLFGEIERIDAARGPAAQGGLASADSGDADRNLRATNRQRRTAQRSPEARKEALIEAGFSPDRAALIAKRESELQMELMQARFEARRTGEPFNFGDADSNPETKLRAEIGETEYEMYLQASNRPTSVRVGGVLESSPAQRAGLLAGDQIVRYDGQRVFSVRELTEQTLLGTPGQNVIVDIERDGVPMQVVLPRGPLGIMGGRR